MVAKRFFLILLFLTTLAVAQAPLDNPGFQSWLDSNVDFIVFDVRGDSAVDSILYPCFYAPGAETPAWIDSINCHKRLLIYCHSGVLAQNVSTQVVNLGYPADSVFYSGFSQLTVSRRPASDTLPLKYLDRRNPLPQSLSAQDLWSIMLSKRGVKLIDVRSSAETSAGMIPGACNIAWPSPFQTDCLALDKSLDIILYCASGNRAGQARNYMIQNGFDASKVINFGGFSKWLDLNGPTTTVPTGDCQCLGIEKGSVSLPGGETWIQVRPNPFNAAVKIAGSGERIADSKIGIAIYDIKGKMVHKLSATGYQLSAGITWNPSGLPAGVYFLRTRIGGKTLSKQLIYRR